MKPVKAKKEKESFGKALMVYGFIAIALIGFLGYVYGSIAIAGAFILAPLLFKGAGNSGDGMFSKSPTTRIKEAWQGADKKKKAGIVIGIIALLPFFILGIIWLAMVGAMFFIDLLFIIPILLIILWLWFRNPDHQTFSGSASLGHPAVLGVGVVMILIIAIVAGMNYMEIHKYDGIPAKDVVKSYTTPSEIKSQDTDNDGTPDINDTDIDGDNIPNDIDIDQNGDRLIDNFGVIANMGNYNNTTQNLIADQYQNISNETKAYVDPTPPFNATDFTNDGTPKTYDVIFHVYDPFADEVFPLQRTVNYVSMTSFLGLPINLKIPIPKTVRPPVYNVTVDNTTLNATINATESGETFVKVNNIKMPLATTEKATPIPNMHIEIIAKASDPKYENPNSHTATYDVITDATGTAIVKDITVGDYTLRVEGAGYLYFQTDFRVTNKTRENTIFLTPAYQRVKIHFKAYDYEEHPLTLVWGGEAQLNFDVNKTRLYTLGYEVEGYTKSDYENILRQNSMYGWSGLPNLVINPSLKTNKVFQSMYNSMIQGLSSFYYGQRKDLYVYFQSADIHLSASYEQGGTSGTSIQFAQVYVVSGSEHTIFKDTDIEYVVWANGMVAGQDGAVIYFNVNGDAYFKKDLYERHVGGFFIDWKGSEEHDVVDIPIHYSFTQTLMGKDYQIFYQT